MTDHDTLDEFASAHLDGATSPEEAARIAADPALQARVEELRAVRTSLQALPAVDPARREAAITAALTAFAEEADGAGAEGAPIAPVTSLAAVAARRRPTPKALKLAGVAAAVLLVAVLVPLLGKLGGSDDAAETAERSTNAQDGAGGAAADQAAPPESEMGLSTTTAYGAPGPPVDLGRFDDLEALVAAAEQSDPRDAPAAASGSAEENAAASCAADQTSDAVVAGASLVRTLTATLDEAPVVVLILTDVDGARSLRVFDSATCTSLTERPL